MLLSETVKAIDLLVPAALILGGLLLGIIIEMILLKRLRIFFDKVHWIEANKIISNLRGMIILWFFLAGVYSAAVSLPLEKNIDRLVGAGMIILFVGSVTIVLSRFSTGIFSFYTKRTNGALPAVSIFKHIIKFTIFILGILIILQSLGIPIAPLITALGVGGIAVALALQETLSNTFAGIQIIAARQIKPGDYIKLDSGEGGYVVDITWRNTTIRTLPNNIIIIPNSKMSSTIITNFYQPDTGMAVLVQVGVSYDSDLKKVEKVTMEVGKEIMKKVEGGVPEFDPFIRYHTFNDFSINFTVILRAKEYVDKHILKHEFIKGLHERYKKEGIVIPFPIRTVYMKENKA
ncbi:mechanosensitive ion channel family protein [Candidatus Margulisiibacteriota bacterium]